MNTATPRPSVLGVVDYYSPGYKAGGPITAVRNLVESLGDEYEFHILTRDRDLGDQACFAAAARRCAAAMGADTRPRQQNRALFPSAATAASVPNHSLSIARRAVCYLSFAAAAITVAPLVTRRVDTVLVYHTPLTTALAALWFRFVHRARIIYVSADLWPESFLGAGVAHGRIVGLAFRYRRFINRFADLLICSTRGTLERYAAEGYPRHRLRYIPVWVEGIPATLPRITDAEPAPPRIVYAGNLGPSQRVDTLIRAAVLMADRGRHVVVDIYGSGSAEAGLRSLTDELGAGNVMFKGRLTPLEAFVESGRATAQYVALARSPLFAMTVPSKLAFCCAAAAPLLYGLDGEAAALARDSGGGIAFDPEHPDSLADAIEQLLSLRAGERQQMRHNLRAYYNAHFAREELLRRYVALVRVPASAPPAAADAVLELSQDWRL